jgi:hypothetical protein
MYCIQLEEQNTELDRVARVYLHSLPKCGKIPATHLGQLNWLALKPVHQWSSN